MRRPFHRREHERAPRPRIPLIGKILMLIGFLTVLYLLVVYVLMPVLAMMTPGG